MGWDDTAWDGLVSDLYLSAIDREAGARLPGRFAALTGGTMATMWRLRARDNAVIGDPVTSVPAEAIAAYQSHYYQHDPWTGAVRQARYNAALHGAEIIGNAELEHSVYYNDFGRHYGMFHLVGALVPLTAGLVGVVSVLRPKETGAFDLPASRALGRAVPHIAAAMHLRQQLDGAAAALQTETLDAALEGFGIPALVLDGHGTVLRANPLAQQLSGVRQAFARRANLHRTVRLPASVDHDRWAKAVAAAAAGQAGGKFRLVDQARAYLATVTPLPERLAALTGSRTGRVLLLLRPLDPPDRAACAAALFGLTEAEAEVTAALAQGLSPAEIATARSVKVSTVRTLLQRAQDKTECRNLRDLVRLVAALD